jgi:hypothetical protein
MLTSKRPRARTSCIPEIFSATMFSSFEEISRLYQFEKVQVAIYVVFKFLTDDIYPRMEIYPERNGIYPERNGTSPRMGTSTCQ